MSIRYKISLILLMLIIVYAFLSYAILRGLVFSSYLSLEKREAQKDILRCVESLRREIYHLDTVANDWAAWNDMYSFVHRPNKLFITSNLIKETFTYNRLDLICIYNKEKKAVWGQIWDRKVGKQIDLTEFYPNPSPKVDVFFQIGDPDSSVSGVFMTARGPILAASRPITTSDHKGPIRGYFIMGMFLDKAVIDSLKEQTQVEHQIIPLPLNASCKVDVTILDRISPKQPIIYTTPSHDILNAFTVVPDVANMPALLIKATLSRDIHQKGAVTLNLALLSIFVSALIFSGVLLMLLRRTVISPLTNLTRYVTTISSTNEPEPQLIREAKDEIGLLYKEFTDMIKRIQNAHFQMETINKQLNAEIIERKKIEADLIRHQSGLREMSVELLLTEERERRRIATDLHDRIGQNLALVQIKLDTLAQNHAEDEQSHTLSELSKFMEEIIHDTRSLIFDISPPVLYEMGLEAAVEWLSDDLFEKYGIPISIHCNHSFVPMEVGVRISAYRAIRELLHNSMKHSGATEVSVHIQQEDTLLKVEVSDNGKGFDLSENDVYIRKTGFGLFSIRENLRALGGSIQMHTKFNRGTHIILIVPLEKDDSEIEDNRHGH